MIEFTIPFHVLVSTNERLMPGAQGQLINSPAYRRGLENMVLFAPAGNHQREGPWKCEIHMWLPDLRVRDHHNYGKAVLDSLKGRFWSDDKLVHDFHQIYMGVDRIEPRAVVMVEPL